MRLNKGRSACQVPTARQREVMCKRHVEGVCETEEPRTGLAEAVTRLRDPWSLGGSTLKRGPSPPSHKPLCSFELLLGRVDKVTASQPHLPLVTHWVNLQRKSSVPSHGLTTGAAWHGTVWYDTVDTG